MNCRRRKTELMCEGCRWCIRAKMSDLSPSARHNPCLSFWDIICGIGKTIFSQPCRHSPNGKVGPLKEEYRVLEGRSHLPFLDLPLPPTSLRLLVSQHDKYESGIDENSPSLSQRATIHSDEDVIENSEGQEGSVSDSAIADEDDSSDWEDSVTGDRPSLGQKQLFQRVDSRSSLTVMLLGPEVNKPYTRTTSPRTTRRNMLANEEWHPLESDQLVD